MTAPNRDDLLTPEEVAGRLKLSTNTLKNWRHLEQGPPFIYLTSKAVRYPAGDFSRWLAEREGGPVGEPAATA